MNDNKKWLIVKEAITTYVVVCPYCQKSFDTDEADYDVEVECPNCKQKPYMPDC